MRILDKHIDELIKKLRNKLDRENNWSTFYSPRIRQHANTLDFYTDLKEAQDQVKRANQNFRDWLVIPITPLLEILQTIRGLQDTAGLERFAININPDKLWDRLELSHAAIDAIQGKRQFSELEQMFQSFDWNIAAFDPLHDFIEADGDRDRADMQRMEKLLDDWKEQFRINPNDAMRLARIYWKGTEAGSVIFEQMKNELGITRKSKKQNLSHKKLSIMDVKNLNYLKDTLKYHGFGEKLFAEMETKMKAVEKEFTLFISTDMQKDKISATLHFRKSNDSENYFFNKYEAKLEKPGIEPREQTIYLDKGKGMTMKEAYNLLDGRAVHKELINQEGEKYKAWMQLDLESKDKNNNFEMNRYHQRYGYDVREALTYYAIKEFIKPDDSLNLVKSLERGNLHTVQIERDGEKIQMQISADPKSRSLNIYEMDGRQISKTEKEELMLKPEIREQLIEQRNQLRDGKDNVDSLSKENSNGVEKSEEKTMMAGKEKSEEKTVTPGKEKGEQVAKAEEQGKEQSKGKSKEKDKSLLPKKEGNGLLEKKRTNSKKGMGIGG